LAVSFGRSYLSSEFSDTAERQGECQPGEYLSWPDKSSSMSTGHNITTYDGEDYIDVGLDLSTETSLSLTAVAGPFAWDGCFVALYQTDSNFTATAYEFKIGSALSVIGKGIGKLGGNAYISNEFYYDMTAVVHPQIFWISWKDGKLAYGLGDTVGVNTSIVWNDPQPSPVNRMKIKSKNVNVTWSIPNRYYINGLSRQPNQIMLTRKTTNAYVTGCNLDVIELPSCKPNDCGNHCAGQSGCTGFNIRVSATGTGCSCELQNFPSTPWSPDSEVAEVGSSHWECT